MKYHGKGGMVYISTTAGGAASLLLGISEWSADMAADKVEVTEFGSTNKEFVLGLRNMDISFSGFWNEAESKLFSAATSADGCVAAFYPSRNAPSKYILGPAWVDASMSTSVSDAVKVSGSISANGAWSVIL